MAVLLTHISIRLTTYSKCFLYKSLFFSMNENGLKKSQSYNLAETIMPASAVFMKNSRSTFGILLDPKEKIDSNKNGSYTNVAFDKTNI